MTKRKLDTLSDIQKLVDQASPALEIARALASSNAPAPALAEINKSFPSNNDLMKSLESASELARQLTQHSDLATKLTEGLPKVNLNLPNISAITASLPKPLAHISAQPTAHAPVAIQKGSPEASAQADIQLDSTEHLGRVVRRLRERRKLSQQEFADLAGVGRRFLSELENGKPTLEFGKVLQVARAAGISLIARPRSS